MPNLDELKSGLRIAKKRLREAEDELLAERRREQELRGAHRDVELVHPGALPASLRDRNRGL